jgi:hypothetical protein
VSLCDLIVADRNEAGAINQAGGSHLEKWTCLESNGIDPVKLGTLWAIVSAIEFDPNFMGDNATLDQSSEDGPWVLLVPNSLVNAIAALDAPRANAVAHDWAKTEEFQLDAWSELDVIDYLQALIALARTSKAQEKDLLLWMSL